MITYTKDLTITANGIPPVVRISQYSDDFSIVFYLKDTDGLLTLQSGTTATVRGTKTDGNGYSADATIDIANKTVTVSGHKQMTAVAGENVFEIVLWKGEKELASTNFVLLVEPAAMDANTVPSETIIKEIGEEVDRYLDEHGIVIDRTLSQDGAVAESKTVGDNIRRIDGQIGTLGTRITNVEDDISYQSQRVDRTNKIKAPVIWEEASGNLAVFDDGADGMYIKDLTLTFTPSQDLHGYDHAWAGGNGKNLFKLPTDSGTSAGITYTLNADGTVTANGTSTGYSQFNAVTTLEAGTYTLSGVASPVNIQIRNNTTDALIASGNTTFTLTESTEVKCRLVVSLSGQTANNVIVRPQVELGSTATSFAPYENICPISGVESVTVKRTGKNMLGHSTTSRTINGVTFTVNSDGSISTSGTATATADFWLTLEAQNNLGALENTVLSGCPSNGAPEKYTILLFEYNAAGSRIGFSRDTGGGASVSKIAGVVRYAVDINIYSGQNANGLVFRPMIRPASISDDTYEPYDGLDTNVDFGQTIYGGTVNPILWNRQGGDIVFDRKVFSVGDLTWTKQSGNIFKSTPDNVTGSAGYDLSDTFRRNPVADNAMGNGDFKLTVAGTLYVKMEGFGTAAGFKAAYADAKFCAKLVHSEIGSMYPNLREITTAYLDNVITAQPDKGNVTNIKVTYPADTKAYIDKAIAAASL